jgi:hypothetical protein
MKNREFIKQLLEEDLDDEVCFLTTNHKLIVVDGIANNRTEGTEMGKIALVVNDWVFLKIHTDEEDFQHYLAYTRQEQEADELIEKLRQAFFANSDKEEK